MAQAAAESGLHPRELSFTQCYGLLNAFMNKLLSPKAKLRAETFRRILAYMAKSKLPHRSQARSYPRAVWGFRQTFPPRKGPKWKPQK